MVLLENPERYRFQRTKQIDREGKYFILYEPRRAVEETVSVRDFRSFNSLGGEAPDFKSHILDYFQYLQEEGFLPSLKQLASETGTRNLAVRSLPDPDHLPSAYRPNRWHSIAFDLDQEYYQLESKTLIYPNFAQQIQFRHHILAIQRVKEFVSGTTARLIKNNEDLIEVVVHELRTWRPGDKEGVGQRWRALINTPAHSATLILAAVDGLNEVFAQYREQKSPLPLWFADPKS